MKFVDETVVTAVAGSGGAGCSSFLRERFKPRGAPDGGDGGAGGSVSFCVDHRLLSLVDMRKNQVLRAASGKPGGKRCRSGAAGSDLVVPVPPGTMVCDDDNGEMLGDLTKPGQSVVVAQGGSGGIGNARFKSGANRSPRYTVPAREGEQVRLRVELRLLADVGLLGLVNAGKSSLLAAVSRAKPKIGDYPFTTLAPQLGVVQVGSAADGMEFVLADIPGLTEGAASGSGLGNRFLRHLRRTKLLLHVVDCSGGGATIAPQVELVASELEQAGGFADVAVLYVCNKMDLLRPEQVAEVQSSMAEVCGEGNFFMVSALSGAGCDHMCSQVASRLGRAVTGVSACA